MSTLKTLFSRVMPPKQKQAESFVSAGKPLELPTGFLKPGDIFAYLDFSIPDLQPVKLSLDFGKEDKAIEQVFNYLKKRRSPALICPSLKREEVRSALQTHYSDSVHRIMDAADRIAQQQFVLFATHHVHAASPMQWNALDPSAPDAAPGWKAGKRYQAADLMRDATRDIYTIWELNRHQHLLDLGKAYWYSGDEVYAQAFVEQMAAWIEQNPYPLSVNWAEPHEIAMRGIFWLIGSRFFAPSDHVDAAFFCRFYQTLLYHGHAVYESLQKAFAQQPPLSLVSQAAFLYLIGTMLPEYRYSKIWAARGWDILQWKTPLLTVERLLPGSLAAQLPMIELYCLTFAVRKANRFLLAPPVIEGIVKLVEQLSPFLQPDGSLCRFGEEPHRLLLTGMYGPIQDIRYLFSMAAVLLKNPAFAAIGKTFPEPLFWWFGEDGRKEFAELPPAAPNPLSALFPDKAFAMMRTGWDEMSSYCIFSTGIRRDARTAQKMHHDLFSLELSANGRQFLIDSGAYSYHEADPWNRYFSSLQAHNTVTVDQIDHFSAPQHIEHAIDLWMTTPQFDLISGYHTGFDELSEPIRHRRTIFFLKPSYWIVCDALTGDGKHVFDQYFHFAPFRLNVDFTNKCVNIALPEQRHFTLMPFNPKELDVSILTGGDTPDSGWLSEGYKTRVEAPVIRYGKQTLAPTTFHTLLCAYTREKSLQFTGRTLAARCQNQSVLSHEVAALEVTNEEGKQYFIFSYQPKPEPVQFEHLIFHGKACFLKLRGAAVEEIILIDAELLVMENRTLFQSETRVEYMTLRFEEGRIVAVSPGNYTFSMQCPDEASVFVNNRKTLSKREGDMLIVSTSRI